MRLSFSDSDINFPDLLRLCKESDFTWLVHDSTDELGRIPYLNPRLGLQKSPVLVLSEYDNT